MYGYGCFISANGKQPSGVAIDADAQSFFTASGITDLTQKNAVNQLVLDLKSANIWTKMKALYPVVGGTSTAHSYNLKNTAQYQLSFSSGWTHSSTGMLPNGAAYANTNFNPQTVGITKTNFGVSVYSRTNSIENSSLIGLISTSPSYIEIRPRATSAIDVLAMYDDSYAYGNYLTTSTGLLTAQRSGTTQKFYQNNTEKYQRTSFSATADLNGNIYVGARNFLGSGVDSYSTRQIPFVAFHDFFDATEMSNYYSAVQAFQTTLSRQV